MCTFKAYVLESTFLEIQIIVLPDREHLLKVSGHSTKEDQWNSPCTLDLIMCTFGISYLEFMHVDLIVCTLNLIIWANMLLGTSQEGQSFIKIIIQLS